MRSAVRTGAAATPARHVQSQKSATVSQQLTCKLWALQFEVPMTETAQPEAIETGIDITNESMILAFDHTTE